MSTEINGLGRALKLKQQQEEDGGSNHRTGRGVVHVGDRQGLGQL